jgi:ABC-type molybdate transport system substrate-binding protein
MKEARDPAAARAFRGFILGERGRAILARYGYRS